MFLVKPDKKMKFFVIASLITLPVTAIVIIAAWLLPDCYSVYNQYILSQAKGQDIVTFFIILPVMAAAYMKRKEAPWNFVLAGCLGYILYTYITYSYITYSRLSVLYILLYSISLFGLVDFFTCLDYDKIQKSFSHFTSIKLTARFNITVAILFALIWLKDLIPTLFTGSIPSEVAKNAGSPVIYANDLGFFLPSIIISGFLLLKRKGLGFALTAIVLVKEVTIGAAVLGMIAVMYIDKQPVDWGMAAVFALITISSAIISVLFFRQIRSIN